MLAVLSACVVSALAGRITQHTAEELTGKVPCGCDNKVGVVVGVVGVAVAGGRPGAQAGARGREHRGGRGL